jgi:hypothetical protein
MTYGKIIHWIIKQGGVDFKREHWQGELNHACECQPYFKRAIKKNGTGLTLDELSIRAASEGFFEEAEPDRLLDAIYRNILHPIDAAQEAMRQALRQYQIAQKVVKQADRFIRIGFYERALAILQTVKENIGLVKQGIAELTFYMPLLRTA